MPVLCEKDYENYIHVDAKTGKVTADREAMAAAGITKLSNLNVIATVKGFDNSLYVVP